MTPETDASIDKAARRAGALHLIDSGTQLLGSGRAPISQFTAIGELALPLWLLIKGGTVAQRRQTSVA